ncbi:histone-like nucleoid-structuring protein Lsr2 [Streptomyces sp. LS1784]|uniref:Lsr2 family DNA-binding protein n=1 Tax=Streptomyces sp. LS1784 TaxID=2851533 RepID=UPI001CCEC78F|nr:histone-like nucleoid-structuring protein Lsr2 [Streptomyces sp. LS1784]
MNTETAVAVAMYRDGETVADIITATGLTQDQIGAAVTSAHIPFVADHGTVGLPPVPAAALISWGMKHPNARMQRLADQARGALADLQQAQRREHVVAEAAERVRQAEQLLADARQALRAAKGHPDPASGNGRPDKAELAAIREWAAEHGHQVAPVGLVPRAVVDAYRAAHLEPAQAA